jgi:hypothetical protein
MTKSKTIHKSKVRRYRSALTAGNDANGETSKLPSMTVPDQSLTVRQILQRFANGTLGDISMNEPFYSEDLPDLRGMDMVQLNDMKREANQDILDIKAELKRREDEKKAKDKKDEEPSKTIES